MNDPHIPKHRRENGRKEKPGRDLRPGSATALRRGCGCSTTEDGLSHDMIVMSASCPLHRGLTEWPQKVTQPQKKEG